MTESGSTFSVASFARELGLAWQKLSMYQPGHPARREVAVRVQGVLAGLIAPTGSIALGVSRDALLGPEERITAGPVQRLAAALFERSVAVIRFEEGVAAGDLEKFLGLLPKRSPTEDELPFWEVLEGSGVRSIRLEPIDFSRVVATEDLDATGDRREAPPEPGNLWERILQQLLSDEAFSGLVEGLRPGEGAELEDIVQAVRRIMERLGVDPEASFSGGGTGSAWEALGALSGLLGQAAVGVLAEAPDPGSRSAAARHVAALLGVIPPGLREGVLDSALRELATDGGGEGGFSALSGSLSAAQIVASLRRLRAEGLAFSPRVLGLVEDLVVRAAPTLAPPPPVADGEALTAELRTVFADEDVDRILPAQARRDRLALELRCLPPRPLTEEELEPRLESLTEHRQLVQLARTLLDLLDRPIFDEAQIGWIASRVEQVVQALLPAGRWVHAVQIVRVLRERSEDAGRSPGLRAAAQRCLDQLNGPDTISALVEGLHNLPPKVVPRVQELVRLLGAGGVRELLLALGEESDLARRRHTFDLLVSLGPSVAPHAAKLLGDDRWYVTRNMLSLLRQVSEKIPLEVLRRGLEHPDARVRLEAVKALGMASDELSPAVIRELLRDDDTKVAEATATTVGTSRMAAGKSPLVELLRQADPLGRHATLRLKALTALGELGDPEALDRIGHFFRSFLSSVTPEERRAAFGSLAGYPSEARRPWIRKGQRSLDREVRELCRRIEAEG